MGLWCSQMSAAGWAAMVGLWAAVLAGAVWAVCRIFPARRGADHRELLDARLAAGDIDLDTYRQLREQLDGRPSVTTKGAR